MSQLDFPIKNKNLKEFYVDYMKYSDNDIATIEAMHRPS